MGQYASKKCASYEWFSLNRYFSLSVISSFQVGHLTVLYEKVVKGIYIIPFVILGRCNVL